MTIPTAAGDVRMTEDEVKTAIAVYLREIHGVPIGRVAAVRVPVYDETGGVGATVTLKAKQ